MNETLSERMRHAAAHVETFDQEWEAQQLRDGADEIDRLQRNLDIQTAAANDASDAARQWSATNVELHQLLSECAPHVLSAAEAEHLIDGFRPQRRPLDDLADRVRAALAVMQED